MQPSQSSFFSSRLLALVTTKVSLMILLGWWHRHQRRRRQHEEEELNPDFPPKSIFEFERAAQCRLCPLAKVYFQYYSDQGVTAQACRKYFENKIRLLPSILQGDLTEIDTQLKVFGETLELPVLVAPAALHSLACPEGEIATARGAGAAGAGFCFNWMLSSKSYKDVIREPGVKWLHLYMLQERDLVVACLKAAEATGAFSAIILSCDHPHTRVQGRILPHLMQAKFPEWVDHKDPFFPNQAAVGFDETTLEELRDPNATFEQPPGGNNSPRLSWNDVQWIRSLTKLPVVAKGILSASDAKKAIQAGVDAIVVSNHGGRQCDFAVPAIEALPVVANAVQQQIPVFVDSGIRTAADIVKALCLGASGVLLGRAPLWALACEGAKNARYSQE